MGVEQSDYFDIITTTVNLSFDVFVPCQNERKLIEILFRVKID